MGRLTTSLAASAAHADNLPGMLPNVSMLDVLLPRSLAGSGNKRQPLNSSPKDHRLQSASSIGDAEIKRDKHGQLIMVRHKGSSVYGGSGSMSGSDMITFEDIKRSVEKMKADEQLEKKSEKGSQKSVKGGVTSRQKGKDEKGSIKGSQKGKAETKGEAKKESDASGGFTAEEDAKLRKLKASTSKQGKPWKEIAEEMGKDVEDLKVHWKELQAADKDSSSEDKNIDDKKSEDAKGKEKAGEKHGGEKGKGGQGKGTGGKQDANKGQEGEKKAGGKKGGDSGQQKMDKFVFTEEQDKELREGKAAGANWKLIARTVKKPQEACKKRWDEIGGDAAKQGEPKKEEPRKEEPKKEEPQKDESRKAKLVVKSGNKKEEIEKPASVKARSKAGSIAGSVGSTRCSVKFSIREWRTLQEDEFFTFDELQVLCQLIGKDGDRSWLRIASAFHDQTGRRVHPEDIREKFEALGSVDMYGA